ncbi:hypothetical protein COT72_03035 [archaeon CG10_big_fil_rev_8_21_14_0_10_43_11]|nr:MAG: hypothetical protein COT72_03035 [archaeon CG10_big_fil_rev_8_21_14_0_10_43_11]
MIKYGLEGLEHETFQNACVRCGETITNPVNKNTAKNLMSVTREFISKNVSHRHAREVIACMQKRIAWQKQLMGKEDDDNCLCRFCFLDLASLFLKEADFEFEKEVLERYNHG